MKTRPLAALSMVAIVLLLGAYRLSPLWPGPGLPAGATPLHITTEPGHLLPTLACPTAALVDARIVVVGEELTLVSIDAHQPIPVVWPAGWKAWQREGRAELVDRDGRVVGRDGDVVRGFGGGVGADNAFHVCAAGD